MSEVACPNCGTKAGDSYCPSCGQRQGEIPSVRTWMSDTIGEVLLVEARLPRTLRALVWPPGRLTAEWWNGRRARYVGPLRLYLFAAIPFFFVFFSVDENLSVLEMVASDIIQVDIERPTLMPPMQPLPATAARDSVARGEWEMEFQRRRAHNDSIFRSENERIGTGVGRVFGVLPIVVGIIMVPFLALLLSFGARPRQRFIAHLVFALHLHVVAYVSGLIGTAFGLGVWSALLGVAIYAVPARREVLGESWVKATLLASFAVVLYFVGFLITYIGFIGSLVAVAPGWASGVT